MNAIESLLTHPVAFRLGWTLVHFVWQGAIVSLLLVGVLFALSRRSANARYLISCAALALMAVLPFVTFALVPQAEPIELPAFGAELEIGLVLDDESGDLAFPIVPSPLTSEGIQLSWGERIAEYLRPGLPWFVGAWLVGVYALSLRLLGGLLLAQRLKRRWVEPVSAQLQALFDDLAEKLRLSRPVALLNSALAQTPTVIGWLKPVVLLPASAITGLKPSQLQAILAHELAHIRRHDYLINLLQSVVETLLFYHPGVWWVSRRIRMERENCCDDLAVKACGDVTVYARALADMEQIRASAPALAATGGSLLNRIRRLAGLPAPHNNPTARWLAGAIVALSILASACLLSMQTDSEAGERAVLPETEEKSREDSSLLDRPVTIETQRPTELREILRTLSFATGVDFTIADGADAVINCKFDDQPLEDVLNVIMSSAGLKWRLTDEEIVVVESDPDVANSLKGTTIVGLSTLGGANPLNLTVRPRDGGTNASRLDTPITIETKRPSELREILTTLSFASGVDFTIADGADAVVNCKFSGTPLEEVLNAILPSLGLKWRLTDEDIIVVEPAPLQTRVYSIPPERGSKIVALLEAVWGIDGSPPDSPGREIRLDGGELIVRANSRDMAIAEELLTHEEFTIPHENIQIETFHLIPRQAYNSNPQQARQFFDNVEEQIRTFLYAEEGAKNASLKGR